MFDTYKKGTVTGKRADHIIINEAAKQTKLSDNAYCCKSRIPPSTYVCTDIERVAIKGDTLALSLIHI